MAWTPEVKEFSDIVCVPFAGRRSGNLHEGGPIWPNWDNATFERHTLKGIARDIQPAYAPPTKIIEGPDYFWAGPIRSHFGHQIIDYSMRLKSSQFADASAKFVFGVPAGLTPAGWFYEILQWLEIPRDEIFIVAEPVLFRRLRVVAQAESHTGKAPEPGYLDRLDAFIAAKSLTDIPQFETVYVSRGGQRFSFAAECYIEQALSQSGVTIFRPEEHSLQTQMGILMGARRLIFAEGSALYLLCLAGRQFGGVHIVNRRAGKRLAEVDVEPRAKELTYHDFVLGNLHGLGAKNIPDAGKGITILDHTRLLACFSALGIGVTAHWNEDAYLEQRNADIRAWLGHEVPAMKRRGEASLRLLKKNIHATFKESEPRLCRNFTSLAGKYWTASLVEERPAATRPGHARRNRKPAAVAAVED